MWRGVKISYIQIAMTLFPLAVAGFWAYGNKVSIRSLNKSFSKKETSLHVKLATYKCTKNTLSIVHAFHKSHFVKFTY